MIQTNPLFYSAFLRTSSFKSLINVSILKYNFQNSDNKIETNYVTKLNSHNFYKFILEDSNPKQ